MAVIYIPKTISELITLSEEIIAKHHLEGDSSPLKNIDIYSLNEIIVSLKEKHTVYSELKKECDTLKEEIQLKFGVHKSQNIIPSNTVRFIIVQIRDVLKGVHREDINELARWGYSVIEKDANI